MSNKRTHAAKRYSDLRKAGVPSVVTAHEAHRMTNGEVGTRGDHSTPVNLSAVALSPKAHVYYSEDIADAFLLRG